MIHLVTGGMRSGKSSYVEEQLKSCTKILYIATSMITDDEMKERVRIHKSRRGERYRTFEGHNKLHKVISEAIEENIMLECVGTLITNMIFDRYSDVEELTIEQTNKLEEEILIEINKIIDVSINKNIYIITNEVGMGLISEYKLSRVFTDIIGRVNQTIARKSDKVTLMVSGIPMLIKS